MTPLLSDLYADGIRIIAWKYPISLKSQKVDLQKAGLGTNLGLEIIVLQVRVYLM